MDQGRIELLKGLNKLNFLPYGPLDFSWSCMISFSEIGIAMYVFVCKGIQVIYYQVVIETGHYLLR